MPFFTESLKREYEEKQLDKSITQMKLCEVFAASGIKSELKDDSVHIKEEPLTIANDAGKINSHK